MENEVIINEMENEETPKTNEKIVPALIGAIDLYCATASKIDNIDDLVEILTKLSEAGVASSEWTGINQQVADEVSSGLTIEEFDEEFQRRRNANFVQNVYNRYAKQKQEAIREAAIVSETTEAQTKTMGVDLSDDISIDALAELIGAMSAEQKVELSKFIQLG